MQFFSMSSIAQTILRNANIITGEYWIGQDSMNRYPIPVSSPSPTIPFSFSVNLSPNTLIYVRFMNSNNIWSKPRPIYFDGTGQMRDKDLVYAEYFIGPDPGRGNGKTIPITPGKLAALNIPTIVFQQGDKVSVRVKDGEMRWSQPRAFVYTGNGFARNANIDSAYYRIGNGAVQPIPITPGNVVQLAIPSISLQRNQPLAVWVKDSEKRLCLERKSTYTHYIRGGEIVIGNPWKGPYTSRVLLTADDSTFDEPIERFTGILQSWNHTDTIWLRSQSSSFLWSLPMTSKPMPVDTVTTNILTGWNLLSLPLLVNDYRKSLLYPNASSVAFTYDSSYKTRDTLKNGVGYWIKFPAQKVVEFTGTSIAAETVNVTAGWNMIGSISKPIAVSAISIMPAGIITSQFFGYNISYFTADSILPGKGYWVKVNQAGQLVLSSSSAISGSNRIRIVPTSELPPPAPNETDVRHQTSNIPNEFALEQNYPNPFNPSTVIKYQIPISGHVTLKIYNVLGQEVKTLVDEIQDAGYKSTEWNATGFASGVYFYRLHANDFIETKKLLLMK